MVAVPIRSAETSPEPETPITVGFELDQLTGAPATGLPWASLASAPSWTLAPTWAVSVPEMVSDALPPPPSGEVPPSDEQAERARHRKPRTRPRPRGGPSRRDDIRAP